MEQETAKNNSRNGDTYSALAKRLFNLNETYGDLPIDSFFSAWQAAGGMNWMLGWSSIQNMRVKGYNTRPADYSKAEIAQMVDQPGESEKPLRQISASLASSAKTYDLIMQVYQDLLTYDWYLYPTYSANSPDIGAQKREMALAQKIVETMDIKAAAHEITGLCVQYGKVFYTPRIAVDKSHGTVYHAFLQQLPEDWCKIVGYNNGPGKYTVAFNMMYFMRPGTTPEQFGDLFTPYLEMFYAVMGEPDRGGKSRERYIYSSTPHERFKELRAAESIGSPQWAQVGKETLYWVTLPAEKALVFEISDRTANVTPPMTGLFVSMSQIPDYEAAQMQIVLNPLTSIMTGELETYNTNGSPNEDPIAVSPSTRRLFETFWYQMLEQNNTSGIGLYLAPAKNLKLQTISDTVGNTNIATTAVADQIQKAGLSSLIPTTTDPKVGIAEISAKINSQYPKIIYRSMERFFNWLFEDLGFKTPIRFRMFGDIFSRDAEMEAARKGMTLGILTDTLRYDAMLGHTLLDDIAVSEFVEKSGVLNRRIPLVSTYSAKQGESGLPPKPQGDGELSPEAKQDINPGGRPPEPGSENGQKTEDRLF